MESEGLFPHLQAATAFPYPEQRLTSSPRPSEIFRWRVVSTSPNPQAGGPSLVACPRLVIRSCSPYLEATHPTANSGRAVLWWQEPTFIFRKFTIVAVGHVLKMLFHFMYTDFHLPLHSFAARLIVLWLTLMKTVIIKSRVWRNRHGAASWYRSSISMLMIDFTILIIILQIHNIMSCFPVTEKLMIFIYLVLLKYLVEHLSLDESSKHLETRLDINCCSYFKLCNIGCMTWMWCNRVYLSISQLHLATHQTSVTCFCTRTY
jgi:hypothetical protein